MRPIDTIQHEVFQCHLNLGEVREILQHLHDKGLPRAEQKEFLDTALCYVKVTSEYLHKLSEEMKSN
jgi:hypothetical protein